MYKADSLEWNRLEAREQAEYLGIGLETVVAVRIVDEAGIAHGYTGQYVSCRLRGGAPGEICRVLVTGTDGGGLTGDRVE